MVGGQCIDAGGDALALVEGILGNEQMLVGAGGDLRGVGHGHHLHLAGQACEPRADGVGDRAAHAGVDLVEHQRRRRTAVRQHDLERQQEARQLAAGGDLHQRARLGARVGLHPELDAVEALRSRRTLVGLDLGHEFCALELERSEFGVDGLVEFFGRFLPRQRQFLGGSGIARIGLDRGLLQLLQARGAGIDQHDIGGIFGGERGEAIDRRRIFARCRAQREQPLLDTLELGRIEIGCGQGSLEMLIGLLQRVDRDVDRPHCGLDQRRRIDAAALQPAHRSREGRGRRIVAANDLMRLAQIGGDLLALHHGGAAGGERRFLAILGRELL